MRMARLGFEASFKMAFTAGHAQAAEMTLRPGGREGGPDNRHAGADQWLYVVYGRGRRTRSATPATSRCRRSTSTIRPPTTRKANRCRPAKAERFRQRVRSLASAVASTSTCSRRRGRTSSGYASTAPRMIATPP